MTGDSLVHTCLRTFVQLNVSEPGDADWKLTVQSEQGFESISFIRAVYRLRKFKIMSVPTVFLVANSCVNLFGFYVDRYQCLSLYMNVQRLPFAYVSL